MVTTAGKGGYTAALHNIYGVLPPYTEEDHEAIDNLNNTPQGMHTKSCEMEGMENSNAVLTSSNSAVMSQLAQMIVTMKSMQAQLKIL